MIAILSSLDFSGYTLSSGISLNICYVDETTDTQIDYVNFLIYAPNGSYAYSTLEQLRAYIVYEVLLISNYLSYAITEPNIRWLGFNIITPELIDNLQSNNSLTYLNGVQKSNVKRHVVTGTIAGGSGNVTFNIADGSGNAVFTNVYLDSIHFEFIDNTITCRAGTPTVAPDKKSITVNIKYSLLLSLILTNVNAPNGTVVKCHVMGD